MKKDKTTKGGDNEDNTHAQSLTEEPLSVSCLIGGFQPLGGPTRRSDCAVMSKSINRPTRKQTRTYLYRNNVFKA